MTYKTFVSSSFIMFLFVSCATNPFTQKKTIALTPNSQLFPMAFQQYAQFLNENEVINSGAEADMISRVGRRIAVAAERYLDANGAVGYLNDYRWDYKLVKDSLINAWCMPGGKIVFYTGILPVAKTETGIAAVMGHEVAHALANHGQQRMSLGCHSTIRCHWCKRGYGKQREGGSGKVYDGLWHWQYGFRDFTLQSKARK